MTSLVSESYVATNPYVYFEKDHIAIIEKAVAANSAKVLQEYFIIRTITDKMSSLKTDDSSDLPVS